MLPLLQFYGLSDMGISRATNEDAWTAHTDLGLFALADGIGGRKGGEVAAKQTIESISTSFRQLATSTNYFQTKPDFVAALRRAIDEANHWIYTMGRVRTSLLGMGTTLCCLIWTKENVYYAHVGDSRIYRLRDKSLELLTRDHSLFEKWRSTTPVITPAPPKHIITRAVGTTPVVIPEITFCPASPHDLFLLCSDGLSDIVEKEELEKILNGSSSLKKAAESMISYAKNKGSADNITVLIIEPGLSRC